MVPVPLRLPSRSLRGASVAGAHQRPGYVRLEAEVSRGGLPREFTLRARLEPEPRRREGSSREANKEVLTHHIYTQMNQRTATPRTIAADGNDFRVA